MDNSEHVVAALIKQYAPHLNLKQVCGRLKDHPHYPSMLSLSDVLKEIGINNGAFNLPFADLQNIDPPFIVYSHHKGGEYALVSKIDEMSITLSNEWWDSEMFVLDAFEKMYAGIVLMMELDEQQQPLTEEQVKGNTTVSSTVKLTLPGTVTYCDIGASYGLQAKWEEFAADPQLNLILVEPDDYQATEIQRRYPNATVLKHGLGNKTETRDIHITESQSCSSVLEPDMEVLDRFPIKKWFSVMGKTEVTLRRFDELAAEMHLPAPDFVKIDVQGFEYEVLEGFGALLDDVLCIELESHLIPLYKHQKILFEVITYLNSRGFYLRHLEHIGAFEGEVVEFNAYFIKRTEFLKSEGDTEKISFWEQVNEIPEAKRCTR